MNQWHGVLRPTNEQNTDAKGLAKRTCRMRHAP